MSTCKPIKQRLPAASYPERWPAACKQVEASCMGHPRQVQAHHTATCPIPPLSHVPATYNDLLMQQVSPNPLIICLLGSPAHPLTPPAQARRRPGSLSSQGASLVPEVGTGALPCSFQGSSQSPVVYLLLLLPLPSLWVGLPPP